MTGRVSSALVAIATCLLPPVALGASPAMQRVDTGVTVVIVTEIGEIEVAVDTAHAPVTAANFLAYVDRDLYEGGTFYRTVRADNQPDDSIRIAVIQGGMSRDRSDEGFAPIRLEGTGESGLLHLNGTISMARGGPHTATSEFFICVGDQPDLDRGGRRNPDGFGFAAFGRVTSGMAVVAAIQQGSAESQALRPPIAILSLHRKR